MNSLLLINKLLDTQLEEWEGVYFKTINPQVTVLRPVKD